MSRPQDLRRSVINQVIGDMTRGNIPSPLSLQSGLAEMYNISRATVRHVLQHLSAYGVLTLVGKNYVIARKPEQNDRFDCTMASLKEQNRLFEQVSFAMINLHQLHAGENFSELQPARTASANPVVVQECLLKFGHYNLIQSEKHGQWNMEQFDQSYVKQLFELREMLETYSLQHFLNLPDDDPRWSRIETMLERHRALRDGIGSNFRMFSQLDRDFHAMLLSATNSIFFNQSFEVISMIFHFHYQWDEGDLRQRNVITVDEHIATLSVLICRSDLDVITALRNHLDTAKQSMIRFVRQHHR